MFSYLLVALVGVGAGYLIGVRSCQEYMDDAETIMREADNTLDRVLKIIEDKENDFSD